MYSFTTMLPQQSFYNFNLIMLNSTYWIQSKVLKLAYKGFLMEPPLYSFPPHAVAMLSSLHAEGTLTALGLKTCSTMRNPPHLNHFYLTFTLIPGINLYKIFLKNHHGPIGAPPPLSFHSAIGPSYYLWNQIIITCLPLFPARL